MDVIQTLNNELGKIPTDDQIKELIEGAKRIIAYMVERDRFNQRCEKCPRCVNREFTCAENSGFIFVRCVKCNFCGPAVARYEFEGPGGYRYLDAIQWAVDLWNIWVDPTHHVKNFTQKAVQSVSD
jgi:hypothetical protein